MMKQEQELMEEASYIFHFCPLHGRTTKFLLTGDAQNHLVCAENCCYRTILKELPKEGDIKRVSMKDFYAKLNKNNKNEI